MSFEAAEKSASITHSLGISRVTVPFVDPENGEELSGRCHSLVQMSGTPVLANCSLIYPLSKHLLLCVLCWAPCRMPAGDQRGFP